MVGFGQPEKEATLETPQQRTFVVEVQHQAVAETPKQDNTNAKDLVLIQIYVFKDDASNK